MAGTERSGTGWEERSCERQAAGILSEAKGWSQRKGGVFRELLGLAAVEDRRSELAFRRRSPREVWHHSIP